MHEERVCDGYTGRPYFPPPSLPLSLPPSLRLDQEEGWSALELVIAKGNIFARMSPQHKQDLVRSLQDTGLVVCMTGTSCLSSLPPSLSLTLCRALVSTSPHASTFESYLPAPLPSFLPPSLPQATARMIPGPLRPETLGYRSRLRPPPLLPPTTPPPPTPSPSLKGKEGWEG